MADVSENLVKQISTRAQGREPVWSAEVQVDGSALPGPPNAILSSEPGASIERAIVTLARIMCRRNPVSRRSEIQVTVDGAGSTYRVTVNGTNHDHVDPGGETTTQVLEGLRDLINAGAENGNVTASVDTGVMLTGEALIILGDAVTSFSTLVAQVTVGLGTIVDRTEAESCTFRVWMRRRDTTTGAPNRWELASGLESMVTAGVGAGWTERLNSAGYDRGLPEILSTTPADGWVAWALGPGAIETAAEAT